MISQVFATCLPFLNDKTLTTGVQKISLPCQWSQVLCDFYLFIFFTNTFHQIILAAFGTTMDMSFFATLTFWKSLPPLTHPLRSRRPLCTECCMSTAGDAATRMTRKSSSIRISDPIWPFQPFLLDCDECPCANTAGDICLPMEIGVGFMHKRLCEATLPQARVNDSCLGMERNAIIIHSWIPGKLAFELYHRVSKWLITRVHCMPSDIYIYNVYITPVILQPVLVKRFTMRLDKCSPISCWHNSHLQMLQEQICFFLTKLSRTIKIRSSQTPIVKLKMSVKNQFL